MTYIQNMACGGAVFVSKQVIVYFVSFLIQKEKKLYCLVNTLEKRVTHLPLAASSQL